MASVVCVKDTSEESKEETESIDMEEPECPICLQICVHPVKLPCAHIFCFLCIKGVAYRSKKCALCRSVIPVEFIIKPNLVKATDLEKEISQSTGESWFYEGGNSGWWQYDERTNKEIEEKYKEGEKSFDILIAGFLYVVDFDNMVQYRRNEPGRRRQIKRDKLSIDKKGVAGLKLNRRRRPPNREGADGIATKDSTQQTVGASRTASSRGASTTSSTTSTRNTTNVTTSNNTTNPSSQNTTRSVPGISSTLVGNTTRTVSPGRTRSQTAGRVPTQRHLLGDDAIPTTILVSQQPQRQSPTGQSSINTTPGQASNRTLSSLNSSRGGLSSIGSSNITSVPSQHLNRGVVQASQLSMANSNPQVQSRTTQAAVNIRGRQTVSTPQRTPLQTYDTHSIPILSSNRAHNQFDDNNGVSLIGRDIHSMSLDSDDDHTIEQSVQGTELLPSRDDFINQERYSSDSE